MAEFRRWLANKLFPQAFKDQLSYQRMKSEAVDAYHWLGAYGDAADALRWLLDNDRNSRRAIGEPAFGSLPSSIDRFRDLLERRHVSPPLEKRPAAFEVLDTDEGVYLTRSEISAQRTGFEYIGLYRRDSAEMEANPTPAPSGDPVPEIAALQKAFDKRTDKLLELVEENGLLKGKAATNEQALESYVREIAALRAENERLSKERDKLRSKLPARALTDQQLIEEMASLDARISLGFGEGGGSPGEWWYERADEVDHEQKTRVLEKRLEDHKRTAIDLQHGDVR